MAYYAAAQNWALAPGLGRVDPDGLGQACPHGSIAAGGQCLPCPEGSDLPECAPATFWERSGFWGPVLTAVAVTVAAAIVLPMIARRVGVKV